MTRMLRQRARTAISLTLADALAGRATSGHLARVLGDAAWWVVGRQR